MGRQAYLGRNQKAVIKGGLAQLGERGLCKPEIAGSNPASSTKGKVMSKIIVASLFDTKIPKNAIVVNTTSRSTDFGKELSPFFLGPVSLYDNYISKNVENGWQYSKLYSAHADDNGCPTESYYKWAGQGWSKSFADRYPMGKGKKPLCSVWKDKLLTYIEARKQVYIPLYHQAVVGTTAFKSLKELASIEKDIYLLDFDAYRHEDIGMTMHDVINNPKKKMGHAFVLKLILENTLNTKNVGM